MSTITAILEADADGTLHLPLPTELQHGKVRVIATLQPVSADVESELETPSVTPVPGSLKGVRMSPDFDEPEKNGETNPQPPNEVPRTKAKAGLWKGMPGHFWMSPDFDEPLEDFREYME